MTQWMLCLTLVLLFRGAAIADEGQRPAADDAPASPERYMVTFSAYRLDEAISADATEDEIVAFIKREDIKPHDTIRLSAISDMESMAQFGRRVSVTAGRSVGPTGTTRQIQLVEVGASLRLTVTQHENGALAKIRYESTRHIGEGTEESPPDLATTNITTTQILEFGKPRLVGASSADGASWILVTVTKRP